jgi:hypothetical protein
MIKYSLDVFQQNLFFFGKNLQTRMKTTVANTAEEVKYVYQKDGGPLLVPKNNVYQETTVLNPLSGESGSSPGSNRAMSKQERCWRGHLFSRLRFAVSILAIVACVIVVIVSGV